jgi:hypothetical protein
MGSGWMLSLKMFLTEAVYLDLRIKIYLLFHLEEKIRFCIAAFKDLIFGFNPLRILNSRFKSLFQSKISIAKLECLNFIS